MKKYVQKLGSRKFSSNEVTNLRAILEGGKFPDDAVLNKGHLQVCVSRLRQSAAKKEENRQKAKKQNAKNNAKNNAANKASGKQAQYSAKAAELRRVSHLKAIAANVDNKEQSLTKPELMKDAEVVVEETMAIMGNGYCHVFNGNHANHNDAMSAARAEVLNGSSHRGGSTPNVVNISDGTFVSLEQLEGNIARRDSSAMLKITVYETKNLANCNGLEKTIQELLLHHYPTSRNLLAHQRMFKYAGMGGAGKIKDPLTGQTLALGTPYPYYVAVLVCNVGMEAMGIRVGTEADSHAAKQAAKQAAQSEKEMRGQPLLTSYFL